MFADIAGSLIKLAAGSPEEKNTVQEQLKPAFEKRFQPCLDLWKDLWRFAEKFETRQDQTAEEVEELKKRVDTFLCDYGALVSFPCLKALTTFLGTLRAFKPDDHGVALRTIDLQIIPTSVKAKDGTVSSSTPGLLMILRDELGTNSRASSSALL